jgi:hypothetical protein
LRAVSAGVLPADEIEAARRRVADWLKRHGK